MPALLDTAALELLRRHNRRVETLALKHYPPVICPQILDEFLYAQFHNRIAESGLISARLFLAPFELILPTTRTPDLCAELRARFAGGETAVAENICWIAAHALEHDMPLITTDRTFRLIPGLQVHVVNLPKD